MEIDPRKTALLILDMQNDVIGERGKFADSGVPSHARRQNVVENVKRLAEAARRAGMRVIHVHNIDSPGHADTKGNAPLFRGVAQADAVVRGSWGAAPVEGLEPKAGDFVIEKQRMNAFYDTSLDTKLRGLGVEKILVTGAWTNFSVEHTCRHGADAGYEVVIASDGTCTIDDEWQHAALDYALTQIAERASTSELVAAIAR